MAFLIIVQGWLDGCGFPIDFPNDGKVRRGVAFLIILQDWFGGVWLS